MSGQSHRSDPRVLNRRTLERDHRTLANLLQPAMIVLDVGCGTGAITAGIAKVVGPAGRALGIDRDGAQVAQARQEHAGVPNLSFEEGDALSMTFEGRFDIVTAARTLQWLSRPGEAIARMTKAAKPGGRVVVLDYNHESNSWDPDPPEAFRRFYRAFLEWRKENQWDNRMADRLPDLFRAAGIAGVQVHLDDECVQRGDPDFFDAAAVWSHVIETVGPAIVAAGCLDEEERQAAGDCYADWVRSDLRRQTLVLRTVEGRVD